MQAIIAVAVPVVATQLAAGLKVSAVPGPPGVLAFFLRRSSIRFTERMFWPDLMLSAIVAHVTMMTVGDAPSAGFTSWVWLTPGVALMLMSALLIVACVTARYLGHAAIPTVNSGAAAHAVGQMLVIKNGSQREITAIISNRTYLLDEAIGVSLPNFFSCILLVAVLLYWAG